MSKLNDYIDMLESYLNLNIDDYLGLNRFAIKNILELLKENKRLNNIINEFDKWLLGEQMMFYKSSDDERLIRYGETKNKWLELKGVDKDV